MIAGVLLILASVFAIKITTSDLFWAGIVIGAILGMSGGVAVSSSGKHIGTAP